MYNADGSYVGKVAFEDVSHIDSTIGDLELLLVNVNINITTDFFICKNVVTTTNVPAGYYINYVTVERWELIEEEALYDGSGNNRYSSVLEQYTPKVDNKGHVVGYNLEKVTLPYHFNTIVTDSYLNSTEDVELSKKQKTIRANSDKEVLRLGNSNKWIGLRSADNKVSFGHKLSGYAPGKEQYKFQERKLTIPQYIIDEAGHVCDVTNKELGFNIGDFHYYDGPSMGDYQISEQETSNYKNLFTYD